MAQEDEDVVAQSRVRKALDDYLLAQSKVCGVVRFGRRRGSTLLEMVQKDPSYVLWASKQLEATGPLLDFAKIAKDLVEAVREVRPSPYPVEVPRILLNGVPRALVSQARRAAASDDYDGDSDIDGGG